MSAINRRLLPVIGDVRLIDTNRSTLTAVIDAAVESGNGASSFETELQTLNVVARWAEERMWLPEDPFGSPSKVTSTIRAGKKLVLAGIANSSEEVRLKDVPTWDDVLNLADAVETTTRRLIGDEVLALKYAAAIRVSAGSGLRLCELLALTVSDIDLTSGTISVTKQLNRYLPWDDGAAMPVLRPKYDSTRDVRVWRRVANDLEFLMASAGSDGVLIPPRSPGKSWADGWANLLKAARESISWKWTPHYLRHHYGSYSTAPITDGGFGQAYPAVQKWMGHRNLKTTLETYVHDLSSDQGWIG
jgi:integrase